MATMSRVGCTWDTQRGRVRFTRIHDLTAELRVCGYVCMCHRRGTRRDNTLYIDIVERPSSPRSPCHTALNVIRFPLKDACSIIIVSLTSMCTANCRFFSRRFIAENGLRIFFSVTDSLARLNMFFYCFVDQLIWKYDCFKRCTTII